MAKKIKFESFIYRFLVTAQNSPYFPKNSDQIIWFDFLNNLRFEYKLGGVDIYWENPSAGGVTVDFDGIRFYLRGDAPKDVLRQREMGFLNIEDPIKLNNSKCFEDVVRMVAESAGYSRKDSHMTGHDGRISVERQFHDDWANSEEIERINVRASNEVCTAPEMRFIIKRLGNLNGKCLLDVGCGLGEASVYFAMQGADVTSCDLSKGMLDATSRLARANGVSVKQHLASAENMQLPSSAKFDIIYAGNLLHHVDIAETIARIKPHLKPGGLFVSWDPLAYNPAINIYRSIATDVRTPDEHPLKLSDIRLFYKNFSIVESRYFWLTTLIIFVIMALGQRRNPNKERFWKVVVAEGEKWAWLYRPLAIFDRVLITLIPPLRLLCWNVVFICKI